MFDTFSRSWTLVKASYNVLRADKELIVFPIVSMIAMIIVTILFMLPLAAAGIFDGATRGGRQDTGLLTAIVSFIFYVISYTVIFFSNSALVGATLIRLNGGNPTVSDGFRIASERMGKIVGYALIAATVGMILRVLSERVGWLGQIVIAIIGGAWNIVTFLVVPVLVNENVGPVDAIKRSYDLLKRTWGEQVVGSAGMGLVFTLLFLLVIFGGGALVALFANISGTLALALAIALVLALIALGLLSSTLNGIYTAALYRYATEGDAGAYFEAELVQNAFRHK